MSIIPSISGTKRPGYLAQEVPGSQNTKSLTCPHPNRPATYTGLQPTDSYVNPFFVNRVVNGEMKPKAPFADPEVRELSREQREVILDRVLKYGGTILNRDGFLSENTNETPIFRFDSLSHRHDSYFKDRGELACWGVNEAVDGILVSHPKDEKEASVLMIVRADTLISIFEHQIHPMFISERDTEKVAKANLLKKLSLALHPERQNSVNQDGNIVSNIREYLESKGIDTSEISDFGSARRALLKNAKSVHNDAIEVITSLGLKDCIKYNFLGGMKQQDGTNLAIKKELQEEANLTEEQTNLILAQSECSSFQEEIVDDPRNTLSAVMGTQGKVFYLPEDLDVAVSGGDDAAVAQFVPVSRIEADVQKGHSSSRFISETHWSLAGQLLEDITVRHPEYLPSIL